MELQRDPSEILTLGRLTGPSKLKTIDLCFPLRDYNGANCEGQTFMSSQTLIQLQESSAFQQAIDSIESLPLETQEALITVIQNRLREKRRAMVLDAVAESEQAYAVGEVRRGSAADLLAELNG